MIVCIMQHDDFVAGCISPVLMSEVTRMMTLKDPVPQAGWLMFGNCTYFIFLSRYLLIQFFIKVRVNSTVF